SRRRHTICYRDWSSDVCSSDLHPHRNLAARDVTMEDVHLEFCAGTGEPGANGKLAIQGPSGSWTGNPLIDVLACGPVKSQRIGRSEERRVGKESSWLGVQSE